MIAVLRNWRTWAGLGLIVSHWFAYHQGGLSGRLDFERYVSEQQAKYIAAIEEVRTEEQTLQTTNSKVTDDYQALKHKSFNAAVIAQSERMQLLAAAADSLRAAGKDTTTGIGANATPTEGILRESGRRYEAVAQDADRLSDQVKGLQDYVRKVCVRVEQSRPVDVGQNDR